MSVLYNLLSLVYNIIRIFRDIPGYTGFKGYQEPLISMSNVDNFERFNTKRR